MNASDPLQLIFYVTGSQSMTLIQSSSAHSVCAQHMYLRSFVRSPIIMTILRLEERRLHLREDGLHWIEITL